MGWILPVFAGVQALGSIQQGYAASNAGKYAAGVDLNNAQIMRENATYAGQKGAAAVEAESLKTRARVGGILAEQGASGVDVHGESARNVRASAAEVGALNALNIRSNAAREAYGYEVKATEATEQAKIDKMQAHQAKIAGYTKAATTILGAAADPNADWSGLMGKKGLQGPALSGAVYGTPGSY